MGTVLDCDFEIDPHDIAYTMMELVRGEWKSDRIDLYTPQDCFGFSDPFGGRIEYSEKKPERKRRRFLKRSANWLTLISVIQMSVLYQF